MKSTSLISKMQLTLAILCVLSFLAACQTTTRTGATKAVCAVFPPISWSKNDTAETITQIRRHNAGYDSYCK